jgi:hypothetical protein
MQHALNSLLGLLIVWGLPVYLLDRRARFNDRPGWMRFAIAFFMLFYFLIVPIFMAFALAGPKRPRRSRRQTGFLADRPPFAERYDPRPPAAYVQDDSHARQANARRRNQAEGRRPTEPEPSRHSQTHPYLTREQRREQHELNQARRRREREQRQAEQHREAEQRTAEREEHALQARRERQEQAAREKHERQERADRERQAEDDLFMTWDERGEEELAE